MFSDSSLGCGCSGPAIRSVFAQVTVPIGSDAPGWWAFLAAAVNAYDITQLKFDCTHCGAGSASFGGFIAELNFGFVMSQSVPNPPPPTPAATVQCLQALVASEIEHTATFPLDFLTLTVTRSQVFALAKFIGIIFISPVNQQWQPLSAVLPIAQVINFPVPPPASGPPQNEGTPVAIYFDPVAFAAAIAQLPTPNPTGIFNPANPYGQ